MLASYAWLFEIDNQLVRILGLLRDHGYVVRDYEDSSQADLQTRVQEV